MLTAWVSAGTVFPLVLEFSSWTTVSRKKKRKKKADTNCLDYFQLTSYKSNISSRFPGFSFSCLSFLDTALLYTSPLSGHTCLRWVQGFFIVACFPGQLLQSLEEVNAWYPITSTRGKCGLFIRASRQCYTEKCILKLFEWFINMSWGKVALRPRTFVEYLFWLPWFFFQSVVWSPTLGNS